MTDREYETLVRRRVEALIPTASSFPAAVVAGGAKNKLLGASGFRHQIDASVQTHDLLVLIECKYWSCSVDAEPVLTLASRLADIQAANATKKVWASTVSTKNATRGARQLASYFGLQLDIVTNEAEYAMRLSSHVFTGFVERANATDQSDAKVSHVAAVIERAEAADQCDARVNRGVTDAPSGHG